MKINLIKNLGFKANAFEKKCPHTRKCHKKQCKKMFENDKLEAQKLKEIIEDSDLICVIHNGKITKLANTERGRYL